MLAQNLNAQNYPAYDFVYDNEANEIFSSETLSLIYSTSIIYGEAAGDEMVFYLSVHNNTDSTLGVNVSRTIIQDFTPINWFCWGVCNLPETSSSYSEIQIPPNSYVNEFSAHLIPNSFGGNYDVEYCFFTEDDFSNSACLTISFIIEGDHPGCMDINAINFNPQANVSDTSCVLYPEPNWSFGILVDTFLSEEFILPHSFIFTTETFIEVENASISYGDWIGCFYINDDDDYICVGYSEWQGENTNILVFGNDSNFGEYLNNGDEIFWQVWDASQGISWTMDVDYSDNFPNQNLFFEGGQSSLIYMSNITPLTNQTILFPENWSLFSTYLILENMEVDNILSPITDDLVIIKNNDGMAYLVEYEYNAIGDMIPGQGYLAKVNQACQLNLVGEYAKPHLHPIVLRQGWNMIGYLREEPNDIEIVFAELLSQDAIQIIKDEQGNAYLPEWNYDGIGLMEPSKGYQVKTFMEVILQY